MEGNLAVIPEVDADARDKYLSTTPCKGAKLVLVSPSYGPVDPIVQRDVRVAMMVASEYGVRWCADASPDRMDWESARNAAAQETLNLPNMMGPHDGIMWIDSDMRIPPGSIASLVASAVQREVDFATGVYFQRKPPYSPLFGQYDPKSHRYRWIETYESNVFAPIDGCGFGFVYTSKRLIQAIARHPEFSNERGWFRDDRHHGGLGEDLNFCHLARLAGFQLWVHTGIELGHMGEPKIVTKDDYLREKMKEKESDGCVVEVA